MYMRIIMKHLILTCITVMLMACAINKPLTSGGLNTKDRQFFVIQNGWGMNMALKDCFKLGHPSIGMTEEHIYMLFGSPNVIGSKLDSNEVRKVWRYTKIRERCECEEITRLQVEFNPRTKLVTALSGTEYQKCSEN